MTTNEPLFLGNADNVTRIQIEDHVSDRSPPVPAGRPLASPTRSGSGAGVLRPLAEVPQRELTNNKPVSGAGAIQHAVDIPESKAMLSYLRSLMPPTASEEVIEKSIRHFESVADELDKMGETYEGLKALLASLKRLDKFIAGAGGAAKGLVGAAAGASTDLTPFHFSTAAKYGNPVGKAAAAAAVSKTREKVFETLGNKVLDFRLVPSDDGSRYFLAPNKDKLVEPVAALLDEVEPTEIKRSLIGAMLGGLDTGRSAVATAAKAAVEKLATSPAAGAVTDLVVTNGLRVPVEMLKDLASYYLASKSGQYSLLYLLGRTDWKENYEEAKKATLTSIGMNGLRTTAMLPLHLLYRLPEGAGEVFRAGSVAGTGAAAAFKAAASAGRSAIKDQLEHGMGSTLADLIADLGTTLTVEAAGYALEPSIEPVMQDVADRFWGRVDSEAKKRGIPFDVEKERAAPEKLV